MAEKLFADAYVAFGSPAEFIASLHTEFGPLNQIVQIWRYDDMGHRDRFTKSITKGASWPPDIGAYVVAVKTEIMSPVTFSPELRAGHLGPHIELRTYTFPVGTLDKMMNVWERAMPIRNALGSPVAAIWTADVGILNSLTHIWPYKSLQEREDIREKVRESGKWPPFKLDEAEGGPGYEILSQQNKLLLPAAFSPLQ